MAKEKKSFFKKLERIMSYAAIILLAVAARIMPHPPNFAPIGGLALFSGAHFKKKAALLIPILAMVSSDLFLGWHSTMIYVYVSFVAITFIGSRLKEKPSFKPLVSASLFSSLLFFVVTNFGVWATANFYPKTLFGLYQSYVGALPFFRNTILSDLFYAFSFFYGFEYIMVLWRKISLRFTTS
jgi:hypothetical protein